MNELFKTVLSLSVSGGLLILLLLACRPLWRRRASTRWQYYIWLVVLLRLLLPFTPEVNLVGLAFQQAGQAAASVSAPAQPSLPGAALPEQAALSSDGNGLITTEPAATGAEESPSGQLPLRDIPALALSWAWLVWLLGAVGLLVRKAVLYQSYVRYIRESGQPAEDPALLDHLAQIGVQTGVRRPVELYVNPLVTSPMLIGTLRPCIVLPTLELPAQELDYTLRHELTHCRRSDPLYKWLVQLALCVHWFNPLVYLMEREVSRACELSCDEQVICTMDASARRAYGDALLNALAFRSGYIRPPAAATLYEDKALVKERLEALLKYQKRSHSAAAVGLLAALALALCACTVGAYRPSASADPEPQSAVSNPKATASNAGGTAGYLRRQYEAAAAVSSVAVEEMRSSVTFQTADTDRILVEYTDSPDESLYDFSVAGGTLYIIKKDEPAWPLTIDHTLVITLPSAQYGSLSVTTQTGNAIFDGVAAQSISVETTNGRTSFGQVAAQTVSVKSQNGNAAFANTSAAALSVQSSNGRISLSNTASQEVSLETANGTISFDHASSDIYRCSSGNGSIEGTLAGSQADYSIRAFSGHGENNLSSQTVPGSAKSIEFTTGNGSIRIGFDS